MNKLKSEEYFIKENTVNLVELALGQIILFRQKNSFFIFLLVSISSTF